MKPVLSILSMLLVLATAGFARANNPSEANRNALPHVNGYTTENTLLRDTEGSVNEKLLQAFKITFPDAQEVQWQEQPDKYTVKFKTGGLATTVEYDKDGEFVSSTRYYHENNLPVNILCKLHRKYPEKTVFGVTEKTTVSDVQYLIKMEDATTWITVQSNNEGNMTVIEKFKKAA